MAARLIFFVFLVFQNNYQFDILNNEDINSKNMLVKGFATAYGYGYPSSYGNNFYWSQRASAYTEDTDREPFDWATYLMESFPKNYNKNSYHDPKYSSNNNDDFTNTYYKNYYQDNENTENFKPQQDDMNYFYHSYYDFDQTKERPAEQFTIPKEADNYNINKISSNIPMIWPIPNTELQDNKAPKFPLPVSQKQTKVDSVDDVLSVFKGASSTNVAQISPKLKPTNINKNREESADQIDVRFDG